MEKVEPYLIKAITDRKCLCCGSKLKESTKKSKVRRLLIVTYGCHCGGKITIKYHQRIQWVDKYGNLRE